MNLFDISGQKALVTGGSGSLGEAIAQGLHDAGVELALSGTTDRIHEVAATIGSSGPQAVGYVADLTNREQLRRMFDQALETLGRLDILVLAHGATVRERSEDYPLEAWDRIIELNLTSCFELAQLAGRHMLSRGKGKIIIIGSVVSVQGGYTIPAYAASKGALSSLTMSLCNEWASRGINVNAILPGYIVSRLNHTLRLDPDRGPQILQRIPAGRWGQPHELNGAVIFLASEASSYMHGSLMAVDGGWLAR